MGKTKIPKKTSSYFHISNVFLTKMRRFLIKGWLHLRFNHESKEIRRFTVSGDITAKDQKGWNDMRGERKQATTKVTFSIRFRF